MRIAMRILTAQLFAVGLVASWVTPIAAAGPLTQGCTNGAEGFSVSYPSDWYTNEAGSTHGDVVDTCTLFAPFGDIEILPKAVNVPVFLKVESGPLLDGTPIMIDGRPGVVVESADLGGSRAYIYYARLSDDTRFAAFAFDNGTAPFSESRAVLDAMVATVDFDGQDPSQAELERVVFELTLSGKVDTGDTFGIYRQCTDSLECTFIHDQDIVCSADELSQDLYSLEDCASRTYRLSYELPAGAGLEYGIIRWTGTLDGEDAQYLLRDSVIVPEGGITLRLGYNFDLGAPPRPQALPDTAVPRDHALVPIGLVLIATSMVLWRARGTTRSRGTRSLKAPVLAIVLALIIAAPASAEEAGTDMGQVVFRVTLSGAVDPADAFAVWTHCAGESCQPSRIPGITWPDPYERSVVACGRGLADQATCTATTYEWTLAVEPGPLHYRFVRTRDVMGEQEELLQTTGTWQVHSGRQVISLGYAYGSTPGGPLLPDTAQLAP